MSKTPKFDAKIKALLDATRPGERTDPYTLEKWTLTQEEIDRCRTWNVPPSALAPMTRMRELAGWGAGIDLWWKPHMLTGKSILSGIHPDSMVPVLPDAEWFSKDWGIEQGMDYDLSKSIFAQSERLFRSVPYPALSTHKCENVIGCGMVECTNCFMIFGTARTKDSSYTLRTSNSERCMDTVFVDRCEKTFSSAMSGQLNNCVQAFSCMRCHDCAFLFDCTECESCFCSTNLRRKKYVFMNEQLTQEEYEKRMAQIDLSKTSVFEKYRQEFLKIIREKAIWPENFSEGCTNCTGDGMVDCLDCTGGYQMVKSKNVHDGWFIFNSENVDTTAISFDSGDCYYTSVAINGHDMKFCFIADFSLACEYCVDCRNVEYCFGCVGLNRKKFCIFNKQYTEEEYWSRLDEIKCAMLDQGEYGRFFPPAYSPLSMKFGFSYLLSPFSKDELTRMGAPDLDAMAGVKLAPYGNAEAGDAAAVPDGIADVEESVVGKQFYDKDMNRRFSVNQSELANRKENGYPFPRHHHTYRMKELYSQCNTPALESATCAKCNAAITVNHNATFTKRTIYCKTCYYAFLNAR